MSKEEVTLLIIKGILKSHNVTNDMIISYFSKNFNSQLEGIPSEYFYELMYFNISNAIAISLSLTDEDDTLNLSEVSKLFKQELVEGWFHLNYKEEKRILLATIRINLLQKNDDDLLNFVLSLNKKELNEQIPDNAFPVWEIAYKIKSNNWSLSPKQRKAIINTTSYYYADFVLDKAIKNIKNRQTFWIKK